MIKYMKLKYLPGLEVQVDKHKSKIYLHKPFAKAYRNLFKDGHLVLPLTRNNIKTRTPTDKDYIGMVKRIDFKTNTVEIEIYEDKLVPEEIEYFNNISKDTKLSYSCDGYSVSSSYGDFIRKDNIHYISLNDDVIDVCSITRIKSLYIDKEDK